MHDLIGKQILENIKEQNRLLRTIAHYAKAIFDELRHNVTSATISRQGDPMTPILPGGSYTYTATLTPPNATVIPADCVFSLSNNGPNPTDTVLVDVTDEVATVEVAATAAAGLEYTVAFSYTNADGTVVQATSITETVVAAAIDVTGASIQRTA